METISKKECKTANFNALSQHVTKIAVATFRLIAVLCLAVYLDPASFDLVEVWMEFIVKPELQNFLDAVVRSSCKKERADL